MFWLNKSAVVLSVSGPHAIRYLNARLTNDIVRLEVGKSCLAAALTPQGKTEALFVVIKKSPDSAIIFCDGGDPGAVLGAFRRYIVADRVEVQNVSDSFDVYHSFYLIASQPEINLVDATKLIGKTWLIGRYRSNNLGVDIVKHKDDNFDFIKSELVSDDEVRALRIFANIPSFPDELSDRLFLEAAIPNSISSTKGCYTGQEVVERILSHGKSPKTLRAVKFDGCEPTVGQKVALNDSVVGEVVSKVFMPKVNAFIGFISIKNDDTLATSSLMAGGARLLDLS